MQQSIFYELSIVMAIAAALSLGLRLLRQPLVLGYIIAGFVVSPAIFGLIHHHDAFESFSQIGIALLLFIVGLGLNVSIIRSTGPPVALTMATLTGGIGLLGYGISLILGYNRTEGLILATALLFSSTIIVIKALSDKKEQSRLYGQITVGILLAEDVLAGVALLLVSASGSTAPGAADSPETHSLSYVVGAGLVLIASLVTLGTFVLPRLSRLFADSQELLYIFAIAWAFGVASMFWRLGFSIEIGALCAGISLAHLPYAQAISTRLKPLRDFFIVLFFITLGELLGQASLRSAILPALAFSAAILTVKPLLILVSLSALGYTKQTSFKTAVHLTQISEFSIVLVALAASIGTVRSELVAVMTLTALITIACSAYLMKYDGPLYRRLQGWLGLFERTDTKREIHALGSYTLVLIGYHEGGYSFIKTFRRMKKRYVVIDYNPRVIDTLEQHHISHLYGDATDPELLDEIGIHKSELVISTVSDVGTNRTLARHITSANDQATFICRATDSREAEQLYEAGASYVLLPHFIGDEQINNFIRKHGTNKSAFATFRDSHDATISQLARD